MSATRLSTFRALCAGLLTALATSASTTACGDDDDCQVAGENCSAAYKQQNNIAYGCCEGLTCETGPSGVPTCQ